MELPPANFRPILAQKSTNLFRSNTVDDGSCESALWLRDTIGIKSYIDLREKIEFCPSSKLNDYFVESSPRDSKHDRQQMENKQAYRYNFKFINLLFTLKIVAFKFEWNQIFKMIWLLLQHLIYRDFQYIKYGSECFMRSRGLGEFYCLLLDYCQSVYRDIFFIMANKNNFPMVITCSYGKDRTGIVSALVMDLVNREEKDIINEYSKSQIYLRKSKEEIKIFFKSQGANSEFLGSPPEAINELLIHLKTKYGGAESYLKACGLSQAQIEQIKTNVINSES